MTLVDKLVITEGAPQLNLALEDWLRQALAKRDVLIGNTFITPRILQEHGFVLLIQHTPQPYGFRSSYTLKEGDQVVDTLVVDVSFDTFWNQPYYKERAGLTTDSGV